MKKVFSNKPLVFALGATLLVCFVFVINTKANINVFSMLSTVVTPSPVTPITAEPEFSLPGIATKINHIRTYTATGTIPLDKSKPIYGMSVFGKVKFESEDSYARVILVTNKGQKLVSELYPLIYEDMQSENFNICDETCAIDGEIPLEVRVEVNKAILSIENIYIIDSLERVSKEIKSKSVSVYNNENKLKQNKDKVKYINAMLAKKNKAWFAGETEVSKMSYFDKKKLYGQSNFPLGFEYYVGGVIESGAQATTSTITSTTTTVTPTATSQMVPDWDWRNRHGINWITPVKNQGSCGSCWSFASAGAVEAETNLYFNRILNLDLSEQDILSCSGGGSCSGGYPSIALSYITNTGIVNEAAFPYSATNNVCSNKSNASTDLIKIGGRVDFGTTPYTVSEDNLKKMIISYGPISGGLLDWSHAMTLVGWKTVKEGDRFFYRNLSKSTIWYSVPAGSPLIGKTVWVFKNSWGSSWGDAGYVYVDTDITNMSWTHAVKMPLQSLKQPYTVNCTDTDGDGYYWWGLGAKPSSCPSDAKTQADGDDSNPNLGPIDSYGNFIDVVNGTPTPSPTPLPIADFSSDKTSVSSPGTVSFSDLSTENPISWSWNFWGGTPTVSTEKNPTVNYSAPGIYDVSLTATNNNGSNTKIKTSYISVASPVQQNGSLSISSSPVGADVYVDGVKRGVTPISSLSLAPGSYNIKITESGYQAYTTSVNISSGVLSTLEPILVKNSKKK